MPRMKTTVKINGQEYVLLVKSLKNICMKLLYM